jgi:uracil phosphoribosyltransferase
MSKVTVLDHPLIKHKLALIRNKDTKYSLFRELVNELTYLMVFEATRGIQTKTVEVETPLATCEADALDEDIVIVPILRAGLGMLDGCLNLVPTAKVGFIGLYRDHDTLEPVEYYLKVPPLENAKILVIDPMLATGGSVSATVTQLKKRGAKEMNFMCILASPEGIERLQGDHPDVDIFCASIDDGLDDKGYILPGIGDCGDRLYGTK